MAITLPPSRILGDSGHVTDNATIRTALSDLDTAVATKAPSASPTFTGTVTLTGATVVGLSSGMTYITSGSCSAAGSLSINNCFTSTYENYRILLDVVLGSGSGNLNLKFRASAADNSNANYNYSQLEASNTTVSGSRVTGATSARLTYLAANDLATVAVDVFGPQLSRATVFSALGTESLSLIGSNFMTGAFTAATAFDGFSLIPASSTITIAACRVYGYKNS